MARPPKYTREDEKPVGLSLRLPRDLYDQAQHHAKRRQTTLTQLVIEGLQMRLDTPTDPRHIVATQDITVMQELRQMIATEVQAALTAQHVQAPERAATRQTPKKSKTQHYGNPPQAPEVDAATGYVYVEEPELGHSLVTEDTAPPPRSRARQLTPRQIRALRDKRLRGVPVPALMDEYGISRSSVFRYLQSERRKEQGP